MNYVSFIISRFMQRMIARAAYTMADGAINTINHDSLVIVGKPDERTKLVTAFDRMNRLSPAQLADITQRVRRIIVIEKGDNAFLPTEKTFLLIGEWLTGSDIETVTRVLTRGGHYFRDCERDGRLIMWAWDWKTGRGSRGLGPNLEK